MKLCCPHCGVSGSADDSFLGRKVRCPKCSGIFSVDQEGSQAVEDGHVLVDEPVSREILPEEPDPFDDVAADIETALSAEGEDTDFAEDESLEPVGAGESEGGGGEQLDWDNIQEEMERELLADEQTEELKDVEPLPDDEEAEVLLDDAVAEEVELLSVEDDAPELLDIDDDQIDGGQVEVQEELVLENDAELSLDAIADETSASVTALSEEEPTAETETVPDAGVLPASEQPAEAEDVVVEDEPYGVGKEQCWQCGKEDSDGEPFIAKDGRLYCTDCLPADEPPAGAASAAAAAGLAGAAAAGAGPDVETEKETAIPPMPGHFTIGGALREAWDKTKGAKGAIWGFSALMYLVLLLVFAAVSIGSNVFSSSGSLVLAEVGSTLLQFVIDFVVMIFMAGLLYMGVKRASGRNIRWKLGFASFAVAGKIIVATVLQTFLLMIGFLLLILPGIYLSIGYSMTLPLIVDRGMGAWEAMEESRKAVHKVWWRVFGLYIILSLLLLVASIPLGLGLIWIWPMAFVLGGVVYRHLFGIQN